MDVVGRLAKRSHRLPSRRLAGLSSGPNWIERITLEGGQLRSLKKRLLGAAKPRYLAIVDACSRSWAESQRASSTPLPRLVPPSRWLCVELRCRH